MEQLKDKNELTNEEKEEKDQLKRLKKDILTSKLRLSTQEKRTFDAMYQKIMKPQISTKEIYHTIGLSGLGLALEDESLENTIDIQYVRTVASAHQKQLEKVALANGYQVVDYFHIEISQDRQFLHLQSPLVLSIDKPKQENMQFQVLARKEDAVIALHTTQSENK